MKVIPRAQDSLDGLLCTIIDPDEARAEVEVFVRQCVYVLDGTYDCGPYLKAILWAFEELKINLHCS